MSSTRISLDRFRDLVAEALDTLPPEWGRRLDNVAVVVEEEPPDDELEAIATESDETAELLGLYQGVPLDERGVQYGDLPDRIVIFRGPTLRVSESPEEIVRTIRETVLHELGHHFGLDEEDMPF